jgi:hypothetical protein
MARKYATARRVERDELLEFLQPRRARRPRRVLLQHLRRHTDWDEYRAAMREQDKSLVRITIERWGPISTGGFPPELADT